MMTSGFSFVMGSNLEATWLLLNTIQLISMIPAISIEIPTLFRAFTLRLLSLHGQINFIPNIFNTYLTEGVNTSPINEYFKLLKFDTTHFVLNSGSNIEIWGAILTLGLFSWLLYSINPSIKQKWLRKLIVKADTTIRYKFMIRSISVSFLFLCIAALIEVRGLSWKGNW